MLSLRREYFYQFNQEVEMSILKFVLLGIGINVAILAVLGKTTRNKMTYDQYLEKYGSIADNYPESYSNANDYM